MRAHSQGSCSASSNITATESKCQAEGFKVSTRNAHSTNIWSCLGTPRATKLHLILDHQSAWLTQPCQKTSVSIHTDNPQCNLCQLNESLVYAIITCHQQQKLTLNEQITFQNPHLFSLGNPTLTFVNKSVCHRRQFKLYMACNGIEALDL